MLIELSAKLIAEQMPMMRGVMGVAAKRFNATTLYRGGGIIDFLKRHYVLTMRTDSASCRDNLLHALYGMGSRSEVEPEALSGDQRLAERSMRENAAQTERLCAGLPRHRDPIRKIHQHGLQPV